MKIAIIRSKWLGEFNTFSARRLIPLKEEVDRRGIDEHNLGAVRKVWNKLLNRNFKPPKKAP